MLSAAVEVPVAAAVAGVAPGHCPRAVAATGPLVLPSAGAAAAAADAGVGVAAVAAAAA